MTADIRLDEVHQLLLGIRDREPYIVRIDPTDGRVALFLPSIPSKPGHIKVWFIGDGTMEVSLVYLTHGTSGPETAEERARCDNAAAFHYQQYPERPGLRLDRDYPALRELRERRFD